MLFCSYWDCSLEESDGAEEPLGVLIVRTACHM